MFLTISPPLVSCVYSPSCYPWLHDSGKLHFNFIPWPTGFRFMKCALAPDPPNLTRYNWMQPCEWLNNRVAILPIAMVLAASLFTAPSSRMRTSLSSILGRVCCPWPTLGLTPMDLNSLFVWSRAVGSMASTSCLARWRAACKSWMLSRLSDRKAGRRAKNVWLRIADSSRMVVWEAIVLQVITVLVLASCH